MLYLIITILMLPTFLQPAAPTPHIALISSRGSRMHVPEDVARQSPVLSAALSSGMLEGIERAVSLSTIDADTLETVVAIMQHNQSGSDTATLHSLVPWQEKLKAAATLAALDYLLLDEAHMKIMSAAADSFKRQTLTELQKALNSRVHVSPEEKTRHACTAYNTAIAHLPDKTAQLLTKQLCANHPWVSPQKLRTFVPDPSARLNAPSSNGSSIVSIAGDSPTIRIYDVITGEQTGEPFQFLDSPESAWLNDRAKKLIVSLRNRRICICDTESRTETTLPDEAFSLMACSDDGLHLATASTNNTIRFWTMNGEPTGPTLMHEFAVALCCFSHDGSRIVSIMQRETDKLTSLWSTRTGELLCRFLGSGPIDPTVFTQDPTIIAVLGGSKVALMRTTGETRFPLILLPAETCSFRRSHDPTVVMIKKGKISICNWKQGTVISPDFGKKYIDYAHMNPDGSRIVAYDREGTFTLWTGNTSISGLLDYWAKHIKPTTNVFVRLHKQCQW